MRMTIQDLLNQIEPFCIEYKIGKSQFGKLSCNNPNLINDLRGGQSPTLTTVHRVLKFLYEYKREKDREMARFFRPRGDTGISDVALKNEQIMKDELKKSKEKKNA